jgi:hypothetical protein
MQEEQGLLKNTGMLVFLGLAALTALEFAAAALEVQWWSVYIIIGLVKAWLVIVYYMHFPRLFAEEQVEHDS